MTAADIEVKRLFGMTRKTFRLLVLLCDRCWTRTLDRQRPHSNPDDTLITCIYIDEYRLEGGFLMD